MLIPFILPHMFHRCMYTCMSVYQMSPGCVHIQINVPRMCIYLIKHRMLQTYKCTTCEKIRMHPPDVHMHIKCSLFVYSCECPQNETPGFKVDKHIPKYPLQMHYSKCTKYIYVITKTSNLSMHTLLYPGCVQLKMSTICSFHVLNVIITKLYNPSKSSDRHNTK
jgi:hypothetical protein